MTAGANGGRLRNVLIAMVAALALLAVVPTAAQAIGTTPGSIAFPNTAVGGLATATITAKKSCGVFANTACSGFKIAMDGANPSDTFVIVSRGNCPADGGSLGSDCTFTVGFQPTRPDIFTGKVNVSSDATFNGGTSTITLSGIVPVRTYDIRDGADTTTLSSYDFHHVGLTDTASNTFLIKNTGTLPMNGFTRTITGAGASQYSIPATTCTATLAARTSCTVTVKYTPTATGPAPAALAIGTTDFGAQNIAISGSGDAALAPSVQLQTSNGSQQTVQDFNGVPLPTTVAYTTTVTNTGNATLTGMTNQTVTGTDAAYFARTTTCAATLGINQSCTITIGYTPPALVSNSATLTLSPTNATARTMSLVGRGATLGVRNNTTVGATGQKSWLDSQTVAIGSDGDRARFTLDVATEPGHKVSDVLISTAATTDDNAPAASTFTNIPEDGLGSVKVSNAPGGSTRQLVSAEMSLNALNNSGWATGLKAGDIKSLLGTSYPSCSNYVGKSATQRIWLRVRDDSGTLSAPVGSMIRTTNTFGCDFTEAFASLGGLSTLGLALVCNGTCAKVPGPANPYDQRITDIGGTGAPALTQNAVAKPGQAVTVTFKTKGASDNAAAVNGVQWRIRNTITNAMFTKNGAGWTACASPCTTGFTTGAGSQITFPNGAGGVDRSITFTPPSRGHWVVEGALMVGTNYDAAYFDYLGAVNVNSPDTASPTITVTGVPGSRPNTNSAYDIHANVADPSDPVNTWDSQGGRPTLIEWDLDNNATNGPGNDGFEDRVVGDPDTGLPVGAIDRHFDTTGKAPGTYTVRIRVTDNGAVNGSDIARSSKIYSTTFTINSPPQPNNKTVHFEADDTQGQTVTLTGTDADGDPLTYTVAGLQSTNGNLVAGGANGSAAAYTWNGTFTGIDTYAFVAHDDHAGVATGTVRVHVRPNTGITSVAVPGTPATHATQTQTQDFAFSSPQAPIAGYECRLDRNGSQVDGWASCSATSTGTKSYADLADGSYVFSVRAINGDGDKDGTPATYAWRVDTTPPATVYVAGSRNDAVVNRQADGSPLSPVGKTKDTTPQFKLQLDDASPQETATYECRIDYGPRADLWKPCGANADVTGSAIIDLVDADSPWWLNAPLPEGTYTFEARATDEVGLQGSGTTRTFTVDLTPPPTTIDSGPEGLLNTRDVTYSASSLETGSIFDCKLVKHSESQPDQVLFPVSASDPWYSVDGFRPCPGGAAPAFTGLADGKYTLTVAAVDEAGNSDPSPEVVDFEVDATKPTTTIDTMLPAAQQSRTVTVAFHGNDARDDDSWYGPGVVTRFECRFDSNESDDWLPCQSPETYGGLTDGSHTLDVRSIDQAGNVDDHPASVSFRVDNTAPETSITSSPDAYSNEATPAIAFAADEAVSGYECKLFAPGVDPETVDWAPCTSPTSPTIDSDGPWSFEVRATDLAGNLEGTPATASWVQDTVVPTITLDAHPSNPSTGSDAHFAFTAADETSPNVSTECKVDGGAWASCISPETFAGLSDGPHDFAVRAIDEAGNESAEATYHWGIYTAAPAALAIDDVTPSTDGPWTVRTFQAAYTPSSDAAVVAQCSLDGALWATCPQSPDRPNRFTATGLADGEHVFRLRAKDPAGNLSAVTERRWTVDTVAPHTVIDSAPSGLLSSATASFKLSSNEVGSTFACRLDAGDWQPCNEIQPANAISSSEFELRGLAEGWHTLTARATDAAKPSGNVDQSVVTRKWKVDTTAPSATLTSSPPGLSPVKEATFSFESEDPDATFQCKIGLAAWGPCSSPVTYKDLDEGDQTFLVEAIDPAGNVQPEPTEHKWIIAVPSTQVQTPPSDDPPAAGSNALNGKLTAGTIKLGSLPELVLSASQLTVAGSWDKSSGALVLPKDKVRFTTISVDAGSVVPGATAKIILSAAGDGSGTLPDAGGTASVKLPVTAKVEVYAASGAPLLNLGASSTCTIGPIDFDLSGTYVAATKTGTFANGGVSVPGAGAGCGPIGATLGSAIGIPSSTNAVSLTITFADGSGTVDPPADPPVDKPTVTPKEAAVKLAAKTASVSSKGKVPVTVACTSTQTIDSCSAGKVTLKAKVKTKKKKGKKLVTVTKTVAVGSGSYGKLTPGKTGKVSIALNKTGKALAKPGKSFKVSTVVQSSAKGAKAVTGTLTLKYPKAKKSTKKSTTKANRTVTSSTTVPDTAEQGKQD